jgi:hypothetical protein
MKPHSKESRKTKKVCKFVLEINGGLAKKMNMKEGDLVGTTLLSKNIRRVDKDKKTKTKTKTLEPLKTKSKSKKR